MARLLFALTLFLSSTATTFAAPVPVVPPDPLPKGATARLGSLAFRGPHARGLTFSPDGKTVLARAIKDFDSFRHDKQGLSAWDAETGKALTRELVTPPNLVQFKDKFGAVTSKLLGDRIVWLPSPATRDAAFEVIVAEYGGKVINRFEVAGKPNFGFLASYNEFAGTAFAPSGRYLATTVANGQEVVVYDLNTGKEVLSAKNDQKGQPQVCFARDRDTLYVKSAGKPLRRFEVKSGKELSELAGTDDGITQVAESPDGKWVVTGRRYAWKPIDGKAQFDRVNELEIRDGASGKLVGQLNIAGAPESIAFTDAEALIVQTAIPQLPTVGSATFSRWNVVGRTREWEVPGAGYGFVLSPDNTRFATAGFQRVLLYDAKTGERLIDPNGHSGPVEWVSFAADGKTIHTAGPGEVITWTTAGQRKRTASVPELRQSIPAEPLSDAAAAGRSSGVGRAGRR